MFKAFLGSVIGFVVFAVAGAANAVVIGFTSNPTTNSSDWANQISILGGSVNSNVDFDAHPLGPLQNNFYTASDGVALSGTNLNDIQFGAGPGEGNTFSTPLSAGEGLHAPSNFLFDPVGFSTLTITFDAPIFGAGLSIIDYFNPFNTNPLTIEAFTGANGSGASLGSFSSVAFNFQRNNIYFMGIVDTDAAIRSIVFTDVNGNTGDITGIDDIVFASSGVPPTSVPEPATLALLGAGLLGLGMARRRKKLLNGRQ